MLGERQIGDNLNKSQVFVARTDVSGRKLRHRRVTSHKQNELGQLFFHF